MGTMVGLAVKWKIESGLPHRQLLFIPIFLRDRHTFQASASSGRWLL